MDRNDQGAGAPPVRAEVSEGVRAEVRSDVGCVSDARDPLFGVPFEELVRRRLRPVVATLAEGPDAGSIFREVVEQVERALVGLALERTGGNQQRAARLLGISRNTVRAKRDDTGAVLGGDGNGRAPR